MKAFTFRTSSTTDEWATKQTNANRPKNTTKKWGLPEVQIAV